MGERRALRRAVGSLGLSLPDPAFDALARYEELLGRIAVPRGFVARSDAGRLAERHVADSLRALPHVPAEAEDLVDLGTGAGLPGIPLSIARPGLQVLLVERVPRKAAFCELVVDEMRLGNVHVHVGPLEDVAERFDVATARALAPARRAWELAAPLLRPSGRLIHFTGRGAEPPRELPGAGDIRVEAPEVRADTPEVLAHGGPLVIISAE